MSKPTVLYNGSCPVCRTEIDHYRRVADQSGASLGWHDMSADIQSPLMTGIDSEAMRRRLHVVDDDGTVLMGVPAFARVWERLPRYRWLAKLVRLPLVRTIAAGCYEVIAAGLYAWDRRRRRAAGVPVGELR
ncbi:MAG: DUF393 domain-containing protein [Pseudomonadota bacterium]